MFCQECKVRNATIHLTKVINNNAFELHLCNECAQQKFQDKIIIETHQIMPQNVFATLIPALMGQSGFSGTAPVEQFKDITCSTCKIKLSQFIESGFLGCSMCYNSFRDLLDSLLRKIHGSSRHTGKILKRRGGRLKLKRELKKLKKDLEESVKIENYEKAAQLRDIIRNMEKNNEK